jgi:hypothetical protein
VGDEENNSFRFLYSVFDFFDGVDVFEYGTK